MNNFLMVGALGRMGKAIIQLANTQDKARAIAGIEKDGHSLLEKDITVECELKNSPEKFLPLLSFSLLETQAYQLLLQKAQGFIDFSSPLASLQMLELAARHKKVAVIGTTGWTPQQLQQVKEYSQEIPVLLSSNMSIGVNALFTLTQMASRILLKKGYNPEIIEIHHRQKKDAPSGTAKTLESIILEETKWTSANVIYGRKGMPGARPENQLGVMSLRGGDVTGEHSVYFLGEGERLELKHLATSRTIFASGALLALDFICQKRNGLFSMQDVLQDVLS